MKHIVILGDGMADEPIEALGGLTPLQAADTPYMDKLAALGRNGRLKTVPDGFHPGSEVANMAVLGYNMPKVYEGRGVLEAASIGVELQPGDLGKAIPEGAVDNAQLRDVNEAIRSHAIEQVGKKLRGYMTDMKRIAVAG